MSQSVRNKPSMSGPPCEEPGCPLFGQPQAVCGNDDHVTGAMFSDVEDIDLPPVHFHPQLVGHEGKPRRGKPRKYCSERCSSYVKDHFINGVRLVKTWALPWWAQTFYQPAGEKRPFNPERLERYTTDYAEVTRISSRVRGAYHSDEREGRPWAMCSMVMGNRPGPCSCRTKTPECSNLITEDLLSFLLYDLNREAFIEPAGIMHLDAQPAEREMDVDNDLQPVEPVEFDIPAGFEGVTESEMADLLYDENAPLARRLGLLLKRVGARISGEVGTTSLDAIVNRSPALSKMMAELRARTPSAAIAYELIAMAVEADNERREPRRG